MASKKFKILLTVCLLLSVGAFAQTTGGYDVYDSTVVTKKGMAQQNEFWNNTYSFPAKPRNMLEVGISGGLPTVSGDVTARIPSFGFAAHVRKAFGYVFSLRLQYLYGNAKGLAFNASENYSRNPAWNKYASIQRDNNGRLAARRGQGGPLSTTGGELVYYNYKTNIQDLSLQGIFTLNNVRFHKQKTGFIVYGGAGIGASVYNTFVNSQDAAGNTYAALYNNTFTRFGNSYKDRKDILNALKDGMDDTYETRADIQGNRRPKLNDKTLKPSGTLLVGLAFKLGKRINLAIEDRHTFVKDDLLDGQRWQEQAYGDPVLTRDFDSYNYLSVGLNFNLGAKSVEPLYWLNPLDYAYSELNNPKHMKFPKPIFDDADGDGVVDQLDREPNTPAGCPVDTHGVTKDTDGDGVPDCKDKQLITPTECQPVDADGVGKCPDPECCKNMAAATPVAVCPTAYPSLTFSGNSSSLNSDIRAMLATVASMMKSNPNCSIVVNGYPEASKASQAVCNKRNEEIKKYLVESQGISADRVSLNCEIGGGAKNTVDIRSN